MKGVFETRPLLPRYRDRWDVFIVLDYLQTLSPLEQFDLRNTTLRTVMLATLLSGQQCQTVHALTVSSMKSSDDSESVRAGHNALWLSYCKPFNPVNQYTISRWVKNVLETAGINTKIFGVHST